MGETSLHSGFEVPKQGDDCSRRRAGDPPQLDSLRNLGASAAVILQAAVTNGGIRVRFGSAGTLTVEDARAIRRENSAVAAIRQQGQSCERSQPINGSEFSFHVLRGNGK